jgi:hypothetical protein
MNYRILIFSIIILNALVSGVFGYPSLLGYSGAPGSHGNCASSCHGTTGGTIQVDGFPEEYTPEETYTLAISHDGGDAIVQFNGSCRQGDGSDNAGVIAAGTDTETYYVGVETNGVRFSSDNLDEAIFLWTAPESGSGEVRLYISGLQGGFNGQNSNLVYVSQEVGAFNYGDADGNGVINILDITYLIIYLYKGGPAPSPSESGDVNCNGATNILDITYLIVYLYKGGPAPCSL